MENMIVAPVAGAAGAGGEEGGAAEEDTLLDFLLREDGALEEAASEARGRYATFKPLCEEDLLPPLPEDATIRFHIDGEPVEIDLSKVGDQATWIRQLLGYKKTDRDHMDNFDRMMRKTESAFQVRPRKRRDKKQAAGQRDRRQLPERDESRMFQEAVDIFGSEGQRVEGEMT